MEDDIHSLGYYWYINQTFVVVITCKTNVYHVEEKYIMRT